MVTLQKSCSRCKRVLGNHYSAGNICPYCGVRFTRESMQTNEPMYSPPMSFGKKISKGIFAFIVGILSIWFSCLGFAGDGVIIFMILFMAFGIFMVIGGILMLIDAIKHKRKK